MLFYILCNLVLIPGISLSDIAQIVSAISNSFLALTSFIAIVVSLINVFYIRKTVEASSKDSVLNNRPYVYIAQPFEIFDRLNDKDLFGFNFFLVNSGKSTANKIKFSLDVAKLLHTSDTTLWEDAIKMKASDIILPNFANHEPVEISLFPGQQQSVGPFLFRSPDIQKHYTEEKMSIYLDCYLSYEGLPFEGKQNIYKIRYRLMFFNHGPKIALKVSSNEDAV